MSVLDKFLNVMRLNPDDDDDFYNEDYDYDDDYEEDEPVKSKSSFRKDKRKAEEDDYEEDHSIHEKAVKSSPKVTPIRPVKKQGGSGMEVCVIKPTSVEDAREITETLLNNRTVVLNVEGLDVEIAQRIIDFTSGSCFAISGNLQKISNYIFIITPASVDISGDFLSLVDTFQSTRSVRPILESMNEQDLCQKRLLDLSRQADRKGIVLFSDFLNLNELNIYHQSEKLFATRTECLAVFHVQSVR